MNPGSSCSRAASVATTALVKPTVAATALVSRVRPSPRPYVGGTSCTVRAVALPAIIGDPCLHRTASSSFDGDAIWESNDHAVALTQGQANLAESCSSYFTTDVRRRSSSTLPLPEELGGHRPQSHAIAWTPKLRYPTARAAATSETASGGGPGTGELPSALGSRPVRGELPDITAPIVPTGIGPPAKAAPAFGPARHRSSSRHRAAPPPCSTSE